VRGLPYNENVMLLATLAFYAPPPEARSIAFEKAMAYAMQRLSEAGVALTPQQIREFVDQLGERLSDLDTATLDRALTTAASNRQSALGERSLGFAVVDWAEGDDDCHYRVLLTDGRQYGMIDVRLTGTLLAALAARNEHATAHIVERLRGMTAMIPKHRDRWTEMLLQPQPIAFGA
jgi:hypothetical protein